MCRLFIAGEVDRYGFTLALQRMTGKRNMNVAYIQFLLLRPIAFDVCGDSIGKHERIKGYHSLLPFNHFKLLSFTPKEHHILANMLSNKRLKSNVVARLWVTKNITRKENRLAICVFVDEFEYFTQVLIAGFI